MMSPGNCKSQSQWKIFFKNCNIQHRWAFPQERKSWTWRIDLWLPGGGARSGSLGLTDANNCFWNGLTIRSWYVALRTLSRYLKWSMTMGEKIMYTCMCNWVPMLYSGGRKLSWGNNNKKNKIKNLKKILQWFFTLIKVPIAACKDLHDPTSYFCALLSYPCPSYMFFCSHMGPWMFAKHVSISGSLQILFFLPRMLFLFTYAWLTSLPPTQMAPYQWGLPWHRI